MFYAKDYFISYFNLFIYFFYAEREYYSECSMREIEYSLFDAYLNAIFFDDSDSDSDSDNILYKIL